MNGKQSNKRNMFGAVRAVFSENEVKVAANAMLSDAAGELDDVVEGIDDRSEIQSTGTEAPTVDKKSMKAALVEETLVLYAAARAVKNPEASASLLTLTVFTPTKLMAMSGNRLLGHTKALAKMAESHIDYLEEKNYSSLDLFDYKTQVELWEATISKPRHASNVKKSATKSMAQLFREGMELLEGRIDRLMWRYRKTDPDFYNSYLAARVIVDLKRGKKKEEGGADAG